MIPMSALESLIAAPRECSVSLVKKEENADKARPSCLQGVATRGAGEMRFLDAIHRRRMSSPQVIQQLWDVIRVIRYQGNVPTRERITKNMQKLHVEEEEVSRQLEYAIRDNLIHVTKRKSSKGAKAGVEQESYKLPEGQFDPDKHDWYCSICQTGGDVICCRSCHRVYNLFCITILPGTENKYVCGVCKSIEDEKPLGVKARKLNKYILLTLTKLRDRYSGLMHFNEMMNRTINIPRHGAQVDIGSEGWRTKYLIHRAMDISKMIGLAKVKGYTLLAQFAADAQTIVHNVVIFHGVHSDMADSARQMLRDVKSAINQIQACHMCYEAANLKKNRNWFCYPCIPPHELVYAKANGYTYWPAKVIHADGEKYDVRFFGEQHYEATVDKSCIQPITTNPSSLQIKRSPSWSRACEELKRHQEMLKKEVTLDSSSSSSDDEQIVKSSDSIGNNNMDMNDKSSEKLNKLISSSEDESEPPDPSGESKTSPIVMGSVRHLMQLVASRSDTLSRSSVVTSTPLDEPLSSPGPSEHDTVKKKRGRPPKARRDSPKKKRVGGTGSKRGRPSKKDINETLCHEMEENKEMDLGSEDEEDKEIMTVMDEEAKEDSVEAVHPKVKPEESEPPDPSGESKTSPIVMGSVRNLMRMVASRSDTLSRSSAVTSTPMDEWLSLPGPSGHVNAKKKRGRPPKVKRDGSKSARRTTEKRVGTGGKRGRPSKKDIKETLTNHELEENKGLEDLGSEDEENKEIMMEVDEAAEEDSVEAKSPKVEPEEEDAETHQNPTTSTPKSPQMKKNEEELVSSSCNEPQFRSCCTQTKPDSTFKKNSDLVLRLKEELEEMKMLHEEQLSKLKEAHDKEIAATKKKQWCYNCELEAIYHCCWNTAYCSTECQQQHWQEDHKKVCRRKR